MMRKTLLPALLLSSVFYLGSSSGFCAVATGLNPQDANPGFKQDMKDAGHDTKDAAKATGHDIKHGTKRAGHDVKHGTKKVIHKSARATAHGARKVENKTEPNR